MKKFLLSLFVGLIGFIGFGYCDVTVIDYGVVNICENSSNDPLYRFNGTGFFCYSFNIPPTSWLSLPRLRFFSDYTSSSSYYTEISNGYFGSTEYVYFDGCVSVPFTNAGFGLNGYGGNCYDFEFKQSLDNSGNDPYTSLECQSEYNLIPIEDIDINYCVGNGLCPNECGSGDNFSGDLEFSNLYINNILHPGRENIFIDIPDYIYWDYSVDTGDFNLYVGSGYDQDYIDGILSINTYKPSSEDFTQVFVSGLTLIFPYIFVALFIIFVWKLLKRVFK